jgi:hypothetical protein
LHQPGGDCKQAKFNKNLIFDSKNARRILNHNETKKIKKMKKPMTLDDFAGLIHKDYIALRKEVHRDMAETKDTVKALDKKISYVQAEMRTGFKQVNSDIKNITDTMVSRADLASVIADEFAKSSHGRKLDNLEVRVEVIEDKVGIKTTRHRAA